MFAFLDFPFIVPSSKALQGVKNFIMQKTDSYFESNINRECILMYTWSLTEFIWGPCNGMISIRFFSAK